MKVIDKNKSYEQQLREKVVIHLTKYYDSALSRVQSSKCLGYINSKYKGKLNYDDILKLDTSQNPRFKYLQCIIKQLCGDGARANDRYRYYYIKSLYDRYISIATRLVNPDHIISLIGLCGYISSINKDEVEVDDSILSDISDITDYLISLFIVSYKLKGYKDILLGSIEDADMQGIIDTIMEGNCCE